MGDWIFGGEQTILKTLESSDSDILIYWGNKTPLHMPHQLCMLLMSTHASVLVDSVGPPSAEVCRTAASFP
jgi:hypothetical protein